MIPRRPSSASAAASAALAVAGELDHLGAGARAAPRPARRSAPGATNTRAAPRRSSATSAESSGRRARGVEDDPGGLADVAPVVDVARGEQRVVGERGADPDRDRVGLGAPAVHERAALRAGDPPRVAARGRGEAVEAERRLQRHQRPAGAGVLAKRLVQQPRGGRLGAVGEARPRRPRRAGCPGRGPLAFSLGSSEPITTRAIPAARIASVQGGWRPWWAQGSSVTYIVAPAGSWPRARQSASAATSACDAAELGVEALADRPRRRATSTAPTSGFGLTRPRPPSASSSARRRWARSSVCGDVSSCLIDWSVNRLYWSVNWPSDRLATVACRGDEQRRPRRAASGARRACSRSGSASPGVLTYVYFALASHNLDSAAYGEIVVLWSAVFVTISVLHRPVEQLLSRSDRRAPAPAGEPIGAAAADRGDGSSSASRSPSRVVALALREPAPGRPALRQRRPSTGSTSARCSPSRASFFARGFLAGERRFSLLRRAADRRVGLAHARSRSRSRSGSPPARTRSPLGIVAAPLFSLIVVPLAFGRRAVAGARRRRAAPPAPAGQPTRTLAARRRASPPRCSLIMLSEQIFLNAGPLLRQRRARAPPRPASSSTC